MKCILLALLPLLLACALPPEPTSPGLPRAEVIREGWITCFPENLTTASGRLVFCETSAAVVDGGRLILASDKPIPGRSAVFSLPLKSGRPAPGPVTYRTETVFLEARKYEDFSAAPEGDVVFAVTGFDRFDPASSRLDAFNTLIWWPAGHPERARVVTPSIREGVVSSKTLRNHMARALQHAGYPEGVPYFKVEGLAAVPQRRLLFGIREMGRDFRHFQYTIKILSVAYVLEDEELRLVGNLQPAYDFDPALAPPCCRHVALSGLEYDPEGHSLHLLTSYEQAPTDEGVGGLLWVLPMADFRAGRPPTLVHAPDGQPLHFAHKAEGITRLARDQLFIIHDDDGILGRPQVIDPQTQFYRKAHQAAYTILRLGP